MNYKQCLEFLELNTDNVDVSEDILGSLREQLQIQLGADKKVLCVDTASSGSLQVMYLERAFKEAGIKCMVFLEKALGDYRNRWRICGKMLSQKNLCDMVEQIESASKQIKEPAILPSIRQIELLVAEMAFMQSQANVLLLEKSDADQAWFGLAGVEILQSKEKPDYRIAKKNVKRQVVDVANYRNVQLGTLGYEAVMGAYHALEFLPKLQTNGLKLEEKHLRKAFEETYITHTFGIVNTKPLMLLDDVYDEEQARRLANDIDEYMSGKPVVLIWGATKKVQTGEVVKELCSKVSYMLTVAPPRKDRISSYELAKEVLGTTQNVTAVDSLEEALEIVKMVLPKDGAVLVMGCQELLTKWMQLIDERKF